MFGVVDLQEEWHGIPLVLGGGILRFHLLVQVVYMGIFP